MIELAVYFGIPLILAFAFCKARFDKAWMFLWSSVLAAYATFGLQPYSIQKLLLYLPESERGWTSLIALVGVFIAIFIVLMVVFSIIFPSGIKNIVYPRAASLLTLLCFWVGLMVWTGVVALGTASLSEKIPYFSQKSSLQFAQNVMPSMLQVVQCGTPPNERQEIWYTLYPVISYVSNDNSYQKRVQREMTDEEKAKAAEAENKSNASSAKKKLRALKEVISALEED